MKSKREYIRRYVLLTFALFVNALGVAFITKATLGTSPISSLPYVLSIFTRFTLGEFTFIHNFIFILIEVALMGWQGFRNRYNEVLVQIPIVLFFSYSIDVCMTLLYDMLPTTYFSRVVDLGIGCVILAIGIGWSVKANVAMNPGEYVVQLIAQRVNKEFGFVKLCFDCTLVLLACAVSLLFMHSVNGIREGTIIAALLVGPIVHFLYPCWRLFDKWLLAKA